MLKRLKSLLGLRDTGRIVGDARLPKVRIGFADFWAGFDPANNYITDILRQSYFLEITDEPDFLIFSVFGNRHRRFKGTKIFFTGENVRPDFSECDYAFSFDHIDNPRHCRWPLYAWWEDAEKLVKPADLDVRMLLRAKTKFCNFVYGNPNAVERIRFMKRLSEYKPVDSGGTLLNTIGRVITEREKVDFLREYKFTIAFENAEHPGYTTEKLVQPMLVSSLPIYWGNPLIDRDFNTRSFISWYDFVSEDDLMARVIELDQNDEACLAMLREPWFHGNRPNEFMDTKRVLAQFSRIFASR